MNQIDPHKEKYRSTYQKMAIEISKLSVSRKRQVGCVVVTVTGVIGIGVNGMPPGFDNDCETFLGGDETLKSSWKTKPEVVHAERNALDKLSREGVKPAGSIVFVTTAPCIECAKSLAAVGIKHVFYEDAYKNEDGIAFLEHADVEVTPFSNN